MKCQRFSWAVAAVTLLGAATAVQAEIISSGSGATLRYGYHTGPGGGIDSNTAHLWQLDEGGVPFEDSTSIVGNDLDLNFLSLDGGSVLPSVLQAAGGATNNARVFADTTSRISFGSSGTSVTSMKWNSMYGVNNANTVDLIVRPSFAPGATPATGASGMRVISTEATNDANQLRIEWNAANSAGTAAERNRIQYTLGNQSVTFDIPLDPLDPNAFTGANQWFHVAFVYEGTDTNNVSFYWTKLDEPDSALALATTEAHFVSTLTFGDDPTVATSGPEFNIGNRPSGSRGFVGAIDMVRLSNVARDAGEFIFVPEPGSVVLASLCVMATAGCWYRRRNET